MLITIGTLLLAVIVLLVPISVFLKYGWHSRRMEILDAFRDQAISSYLRCFHERDLPQERAQLRQRLATIYDKHIGRGTYLLPATLMFVGMALGLAFATTVPSWLGRPAPVGLDPVAASALLGAFSFVLFDLISACIRRALAPRDLMWAMYRFTVMVPMAFALLAVVKEDFALFVAFALGAFPSEWLQRLVRRLGRRHVEGDAVAAEEGRSLPMAFLDPAVAERLADENITNVVQLAYCDPVVTAIRINHPLATVIDYVNQALLAMYAKEALAGLQGLGIRGARELIGVVSSPPTGQTAAWREEVTKKTGLHADTLAFMGAQLAGNRQAVFLCEMIG